jgi:SNF2 family DNA or RNA helicase
MLGDVAREAGDSRPDDVLARALRPVILRRTKAQVASELPPRVEQTLEVELEPKQRAFYDELRVQQAENLFALLDKAGMARSRMQILEALLRLRQAACHPVLADPRKAGLPSAKLDALIPALQEVTAEGHKALVFSQFTSFLALVKDRLDAVGLKYEYLDGRTKDRGARVARFQSPEGPPVFLISLKAGGTGLNLTGADTVIHFDPWWNPAAEAQASDRAHRIGQTKPVFVHKLICEGTIEERVVAMQQKKAALVEGLLTGRTDKLQLTQADIQALFAVG